MTSSAAPGSRLIAVGDLLLGDTPKSVGFGFRSRYPGSKASGAFAAVRSTLRSADIVFGNLECPLFTSPKGDPEWHADQMRGDPEYADVLKDAGFSVLSVSNNHASQHGPEAFRGTVALLRDAGILVAGIRGSSPWACEPVVCSPSGQDRSLGVLAYCWRPAQDPFNSQLVATGPLEAAVRDVGRLTSMVDRVAVSLHWGADFVALPAAAEVEAAHRLIDAGADVILGHHPQVPRPIEAGDGTVVAYSLGSLVADHVWYEPMRTGLIVEAVFDEDGASLHRVHTTFLHPDYRPTILAESSAFVAHEMVAGVDPSEYEREAQRCANSQRRRLYLHVLRNLHRYRPKVLGELGRVTARNKFSALRHRLLPGAQA